MVRRGNIVKDEKSYQPVFAEHGASASQMAAAKFRNAIARLLGMSGEVNDAVSAYTQVTCLKLRDFSTCQNQSVLK